MALSEIDNRMEPIERSGDDWIFIALQVPTGNDAISGVSGYARLFKQSIYFTDAPDSHVPDATLLTDWRPSDDLRNSG
jgi:hypothetical protein